MHGLKEKITYLENILASMKKSTTQEQSKNAPPAAPEEIK